jgi:hypothetical protein
MDIASGEIMGSASVPVIETFDVAVTPVARVANKKPYLTTHPAVAASGREFTRLATFVADGIVALHLEDPTHAMKIRRSPYRTIMQVGPVAITVTWLRDRENSAAGSELLVAVWRGAIAASGGHQFERPASPATPATAAIIWEAQYVADAADEISWMWRSAVADEPLLPSSEVAERCIAELVRALAERA